MFYREAGQFKSSYAADQAIFPIAQDRVFVVAIIVAAFALPLLITNDYWYTAVLIPLMVFSMAALGLNVLVGYCGQISLGTGGFMAVGGYAAFKLAVMPELIDLPAGTIQSTLLPHGGVNTLGLVFTERSTGKKFVYYTDCKTVPPAAVALARGADAVVLDGLRVQPHPSHLSIAEAVLVAREIGAPATWLTHLTHLNDHAELVSALPPGIAPAHDGLRIVL